MSTKLYVGNLPYNTNESDLQTLFGAIAPVETINVVTDRVTGRARGFAFVEMSTAEGASRAISELDRRDYGGRQQDGDSSREKSSGCIQGKLLFIEGRTPHGDCVHSNPP